MLAVTAIKVRAGQIYLTPRPPLRDGEGVTGFPLQVGEGPKGRPGVRLLNLMAVRVRVG